METTPFSLGFIAVFQGISLLIRQKTVDFLHVSQHSDEIVFEFGENLFVFLRFSLDFFEKRQIREFFLDFFLERQEKPVHFPVDRFEIIGKAPLEIVKTQGNLAIFQEDFIANFIDFPLELFDFPLKSLNL